MVYDPFEAWPICFDCTKALHLGTKIAFVRHVNDRFMKYNIPLALLAAVRTLAEGVNAEFAAMLMPLICSHFLNHLPPASSDRAIRRSGEPPFDKYLSDGFYLHFKKGQIYKTKLTLVGLVTVKRFVDSLGR